MRRRGFLPLLMGLIARPDAVTAMPTAPPPEVWPLWEAHDPASTQQVDHAAWALLLRRMLRRDHDGMQRVAYAQATSADRYLLNLYLGQLATVEVHGLNRPEQLAFWINLYNAQVMRLVLERYPVATVQELAPGPAGTGPWSKPAITVQGQSLTLNDLENRILRPIWRDARIHYVISWAARGSPCLMPEPILAERANVQLDLAATMFINHPRALELAGMRLMLSSLYDWFRQDFGGTDRQVLRHILAYARPELAMRLQKVDRIAGYRYDWSLNEAS